MEIYFWFRKSTKLKDYGSISCVIRIDGRESVPFSTKIKVERKNWNAKSQCFEGKGSGAKEQVKESLITRLFQIHRELQLLKAGEQILPDEILQRHNKLTVETEIIPVHFIEIMNKYINHQTELMKVGILEPSTIKTYEVRGKVISTLLKTLKKSKILCKDFDDQIADNLQHLLQTSGKKQGYINQCLKFCISVQKYAFKKRWISSKPLDAFECKHVKKNIPIVLEPLDIQKIETFQFKPRLQKIADAWLFCQETSLAYSDYIGLQNSMLSVDENGLYWIEKNRKKSDELQVIPVSLKALEIIQKYGNELEKLPRFSPTTANNKIKLIAKEVGISKNLTWHSSRKTWANNSLNYKGMSDVTIAKVMGWSSTAQLKVYARINKQAIAKEFFK